MNQKKLRDIIFQILFEKELRDNFDLEYRIDSIISDNNLSGNKELFLREFILGIVSNEEFLISKINSSLNKWSYNTIGTYEKIILKMAFYEILIKKIGYQIAINEALELAKIYGDDNSKNFINGVLATIV